MLIAAWPLTWLLSGGFHGQHPTPTPVRLRGAAVADHHPLSDADQPGLAAGRDPQFARQILGQCRRADPAQHRDGGRASCLPRAGCLCDRAGAGDLRARRRRDATGLADVRLPAGGREHAAAQAPVGRRRQAADEADHARRDRRGRVADQPAHLDPACGRLALGGLDLRALLRRSAQPASARHDRHRPGHRPAADRLAPAQPRAGGSGDGNAESRDRAGACS